MLWAAELRLRVGLHRLVRPDCAAFADDDHHREDLGGRYALIWATPPVGDPAALSGRTGAAGGKGKGQKAQEPVT